MLFKFYILRSPLVVSLLLIALASTSFIPVKAQNPERAAEAANSSSVSLTLKERVEVFEQVWKAINEKYYDPKFNGVDWNAVHERYRPLVDALNSDAEFYDLLNRMTGELRDAHTRVRSPRQRQERKNRQATSAGVLIYEVEDKPVVFDVTPGSDAERAGVKPGMTVRTINDQPIAEALAEARRELGTSSTEWATRILSYLRTIAGEPNTSLKLGLNRADGTPLDVTLTRRIIPATP